MQKINFQDLPSTNTPINATNLNAIQTNVEGAMKNTYTSSTTDTYNCDYQNKAFGGTILWTNSDLSQNMSAQEITISNIGDCDAYSIIYLGQVDYGDYLNTGIIPINLATRMQRNYNASNSSFYASRTASLNKTTNKLNISNCIASNNATVNSWIIPAYVIGYKTGLFD